MRLPQIRLQVTTQPSGRRSLYEKFMNYLLFLEKWDTINSNFVYKVLTVSNSSDLSGLLQMVTMKDEGESIMKFDMHCHTKEGSLDGKVQIDEYIKRLKAKGFGGMLVSDHNSYDGYRQWRDALKNKKYTDFVVLKGIEYDTIDCGHMLVIMPNGVKLKILELRGLPVRILMHIVHRYGGIIGPAHPFGVRYVSFIKTQMRRGLRKAQLDALMEEFDFVEIFNACESLEVNSHAAKMAAKYNKPGFGGSDAHKADCIGTAYTELPETIDCETALIDYVKSVNYIKCGGTLYTRTTKERIGKLNEVLVQGFYFYNKFGSWCRAVTRKKELRKLRKGGYIELKK